MNLEPTTPAPPRWLHAIAVLTVVLTLPLLFLGAGVTSHDVGMVDPSGFRPPWEIINGLIENAGLPWRLEYGHRTFGFLVGMCGIAVAAGCWFFNSRAPVTWLAFAALGLICAQGMLGILRVDLNALYGRTFALVHGCFAQIVFAVLVCVALMLSRRWRVESSDAMAPALQRWSIITALLVYGQLVLGAIVRHKDSLIGPRGHLLGAFVAVGAVIWLLKLMRESEASAQFRVQRILLMVFLTMQLLLGVESWLAKFFVPQADFPQLRPIPLHGEWIRTMHYVFGAFVFSTTVAVALIANRKTVLVPAAAPEAASKLEAAL